MSTTTPFGESNQQTPETVARARKGLAIFFAVVFPLAFALEAQLIVMGGRTASAGTIVTVLMWSPAIASLVARLALREGFGDVSFALRGVHGLRSLAIAWIAPPAIHAIAYGLAWALGLAEFRPRPFDLFGVHLTAGLGSFLAQLAVAGTKGLVVNGVFRAAGEEIGWRGYMLTRLVDARVPRPLLVSGVVWAVFHYPVILSGQYGSNPYPALGIATFTVLVVALGFIAARVRLESGSVWPAVVMHAQWNTVLQGVFEPAIHGGRLWLDESGLLVALAAVLAAWWMSAGTWMLRHRPSDAGSAFRAFGR